MDNRLTQVRPLAERAVIEKIEEGERKFGSIIIPQSANEIDLSWTAKVLAVGRGKTLKSGEVLDPLVKQGDTIIIGKYMGTEVKVDGKKCYVVAEDDILAVVEEE
jgi:chaperonin GroES